MSKELLKKVKNIFSISNALNLFIIYVLYNISIWRIKIGNSFCIDFDTALATVYDSGFFIKNAMSFERFNVTAPYSLIKNRGYLWFLLLVHKLGIDLRLAYTLFWIVAATLLFVTILKASKNRLLAMLAFIYLVLHPIAYFTIESIYAYRNTVFVPSVAILMSLYVLLYLYLSKSEMIMSIILGTFLGLYFIYVYFLTETGIIYLAMHLGLLALFSFFVVIDFINNKSRANRKSIKSQLFQVAVPLKQKKLFAQKILILFIPLLLSVIGIYAYKFINYRTYGVDVINMRTEGEVARFISNVQDIESTNTNTLIWCAEDQIDKAYEFSTTFQQNSIIYEGIKGKQLVNGIDGYNFSGDYLGWAIMLALDDANINYIDAVKIFRDINYDIESAFKNGKLKKTNKIKISKTLGRFTVDEIKNEILPLFKKNYFTLIGLNEMENNFDTTFGKSIDSSGECFTFFNIDNSIETYNYMERAKAFKEVYSKINAIMYYIMIVNIVIAISALLWNIIAKCFVAKDNNNKMLYVKINVKYLILSLMFWVFYTLYILSISFFNIWLYVFHGTSEGLAFYYASIGIVLLLFAFIFSLLSLYEVLDKVLNKLLRIKFTRINFVKKNNINNRFYGKIIILWKSLRKK